MNTRTGIRISTVIATAAAVVALTAGCTIYTSNLDDVEERTAKVKVGSTTTTVESGATVNAKNGHVTDIRFKNADFTVHCESSASEVQVAGDRGTVTFDATCGDVSLAGYSYTAELANAADLDISGKSLKVTAGAVRDIDVSGNEITYTGTSAAGLDATGIDANITLDAVRTVSATGSDITVTYGGKLESPADITGAGNSVKAK